MEPWYSELIGDLRKSNNISKAQALALSELCDRGSCVDMRREEMKVSLWTIKRIVDYELSRKEDK